MRLYWLTYNSFCISEIISSFSTNVNTYLATGKINQNKIIGISWSTKIIPREKCRNSHPRKNNYSKVNLVKINLLNLCYTIGFMKAFTPEYIVFPGIPYCLRALGA